MCETNPAVPSCLKWTDQEVADWIGEIGFSIYQECFLANYVNGAKLVHINASTLPKMGITNFEHIKVICEHIRSLLTIEKPDWNRSITLPCMSELGMFLLQKSRTGKNSDRLSFNK